MIKGKIPTFAGIIFIIIGIISGVIIAGKIKSPKLNTAYDIAPKNVRISNITDDSFSISWITNTKTSGGVNLDTTPSNDNKNTLEVVQNPGYTHSIKVEKLSPSTTYHFFIQSNKHSFDNNGVAWKVKTAPKMSNKSGTSAISGSVYDQFNLPTKNALVYITVAGSGFLSTTTSENGSWVLPISEARSQDLESPIVIDDYKTLIEIFVQAGPLGSASAQIYPISAKPAPPIILGQIHNYKAINLKEEESPKAEIFIPQGGLSTPNFLIN